MTLIDKKKWDKVITPNSGNSFKNFKEVFKYKELFLGLLKEISLYFTNKQFLVLCGI